MPAQSVTWLARWKRRLAMQALGTFLKSMLVMKPLIGWRTKIIGGGMMLTGAGQVLTHLANVAGGEPVDWDTLKAGGALIVTGGGLLTAAAHQHDTPPTA